MLIMFVSVLTNGECNTIFVENDPFLNCYVKPFLFKTMSLVKNTAIANLIATSNNYLKWVPHSEITEIRQF